MHTPITHPEDTNSLKTSGADLIFQSQYENWDKRFSE